MPERIYFRCNNCGHRFEAEALTKEEEQKAKEERQPTSAIHCPNCNRTDIRRGWE